MAAGELSPEDHLGVARAVRQRQAGTGTVRQHKGNLYVAEPLVVLGDLRIRGDLVNASMVCVTGTLEVRGRSVDDHGDARLVVAGDLDARHLTASSSVHVGADAILWGMIAAKGPGGKVVVGGNLRARALVIEQGGQIHARHIDVTHRYPNGFPEPQLIDRPGRLVAYCKRIQTMPPPPLSSRLTDLVTLVRESTEHMFGDNDGKITLTTRFPDGSRQVSFITPDEQKVLRGTLR